jgi:hypothetical protein
MLQPLTAPRSTALTTTARALAAVKQGDSAQAVVEDLIRQATAAIQRYTRRTFARQRWRESAAGTDDIDLEIGEMMSGVGWRLPVLGIDQVTRDGIAVLGVTVQDSALGVLTRESGFGMAARVRRAVGYLSEIVDPSSALEDWLFDYPAGWLLPNDDLADVEGVTFVASDRSINGSGFPLLVAGDVLEIPSGANKGVYLVESATDEKIVVTEAIVDDAPDTVTLRVRNLPDDIERACLNAVADWYEQQASGKSRRVQSKRVADTTITYEGASSTDDDCNLPLSSVRLLHDWRRPACA